MVATGVGVGVTIKYKSPLQELLAARGCALILPWELFLQPQLGWTNFSSPTLTLHNPLSDSVSELVHPQGKLETSRIPRPPSDSHSTTRGRYSKGLYSDHSYFTTFNDPALRSRSTTPLYDPALHNILTRRACVVSTLRVYSIGVL